MWNPSVAKTFYVVCQVGAVYFKSVAYGYVMDLEKAQRCNWCIVEFMWL
jgi:hypothetical protein